MQLTLIRKQSCGKQGTVKVTKNSNNDRLLAICLLFLCLFCTLAPGNGVAATFTVNSRADVGDLTPGNGLCVAYLIFIPPFYVFPYCTLRAAIEETNSLPGADTIILRSGGYFLEESGFGEDEAATGDLDILESVTISGEGAGATVVDGGGLDRIFDIHGAGSRVVIKNLSIQHGNLAPDPGDPDRGGGAIRNRGLLTLRAVAFTENNVQEGSDVAGGGALYNRGDCRLITSSLFFNTAMMGGAIWNGPGSTMHIDGTTVRQNTSAGGGGVLNQGALYLNNTTVSNNRIQGNGTPQGGGIHNSGVLDVVQSTIAENKVDRSGVGLFNEGELTIMNSLIASNEGRNCLLFSSLHSFGGNLDSDGSCDLNHETDLNRLNPLLGPLRDNGGPTWTHALLFGSPAIDSAQDLSKQGLLSDQRGDVRPQGKGYDIGAVEKRIFSVVPFLVPLLL
ncbi:MAG: hypothetical protein KKD01_02875 [Proteobacteria bacterium]|nr:hypothetical protein [Pseudomonadota bacterium]MBU1453645.1 hypothetical protein [Pseudomonadota bacterium]